MAVPIAQDQQFANDLELLISADITEHPGPAFACQ
jgi:hypothetical protein